MNAKTILLLGLLIFNSSIAKTLAEKTNLKLSQEWTVLESKKVLNTHLTTIHHTEDKKLFGIYKQLVKTNHKNLNDECKNNKSSKKNMCHFEQDYNGEKIIMIVFNKKKSKDLNNQHIISFQVKPDNQKQLKLVSKLAKEIERQL
ncbi:MAG: hypothetical protein CME62_12150 [Halobacteriovoraceae bacterium]|nr:hypothetical protein [Halobacteriovoraceae bacterium]|tara:strand:+ start:1359 stop:1793 length:435 start_codon:yes stop_codon:yes gene_type:complete